MLSICDFLVICSRRSLVAHLPTERCAGSRHGDGLRPPRALLENNMRSNKLSHVFVVTILTVLATSTSLAAQEEHPKHHHYKLIDLGTLGGPQSAEATENQTFTAPATRMINTRGMVTGAAQLNVPDPYSPYCLISGCMLVHSFLWRDGEITDLGALPGVNDTFPNWVNDRGEVVGASFNGVDPASGPPLLEPILWTHGSVIDLGGIPAGNQ